MTLHLRYEWQSFLISADTIDYLTQVDLEEKKALQEETALRELNDGKEGAMAIPDLLTKLNRPNEHNLYYYGGVDLLTQAVIDSEYT